MAEPWSVSFPAVAGGKAAESSAVSVDADGLLVAVIPTGADVSNPGLKLGPKAVQATVLGHDPVSRLVFFQVRGKDGLQATAWRTESVANPTGSLRVMAAGSPVACKASGWVKQVGGKVLPLALLRVTFPKEIPAPGTPLMDETGKVAAIVFQSTGDGISAYAIPAEAVQRVKKDIVENGRLHKGWLGLALRAESTKPEISRVLPDSPAAAAGILPNDLLVSVGSRQITEYADAANAFFYLTPGRPVKVKLLRDARPIEYSLVPVAK